MTIVPAPVDRVYQLFTFFHHYPEFMRHVKSVTYYDDQNSHWVVDVAGRHEWDACNEGWQQNTRIGWRATHGLKNSGEVLFEPMGNEATRVFVRLQYEPPLGIAGDIAETLGAGGAVERALQQDLDRFARVVAASGHAGDLNWNVIRQQHAYIENASIPAAVPMRLAERGDVAPPQKTAR